MRWLLLPLAYFLGKRVGRFEGERAAVRARLRLIKGGRL